MECSFFFFQAEDGIRYLIVTGVQTCALPISESLMSAMAERPGGVASATIGSVSTHPASRFPYPVFQLGSLPLLPQASPRDQILLRDAEDVAHGVVQVEPGREVQEQQRQERRHE